MKHVITVALLMTSCFFLASCIKGKPPLRTWELAKISPGSSVIGFSFVAPVRDPEKGYWDYKLGIVIPAATEFSHSGEVVVFTMSGKEHMRFKFDDTTVTRSSWLRERDRISYLLSGDLGIEDGNEYRVEVRFDKPVADEGATVLHFLSHTDSKLPQ